MSTPTVTPPLITDARDLTVVTRVRAWLEDEAKAQIPQAEDPLIERAITAASVYVLRYLGQKSLNSIVGYQETYDGNGHDMLRLRNDPIVQVNQLQINAFTVAASSGFGFAGHFVDPSLRFLALRSGAAFIGGYCGTFFKGRGNVFVDYLAGYPPDVVLDELQAVTKGRIVVSQAPWVSDISVATAGGFGGGGFGGGGFGGDGGGVLFALVASNPQPGQYTAHNGVYKFNKADEGTNLFISYNIGHAPEDLDEAVVVIVGETIKQRGWLGLKSRMFTGAGVGTVTYRDWLMPPRCRAVLNNYRRHVPI